MSGVKKRKIPVVLEERLLIDDIDRKILNSADELSPHNNGKLLVTSSIWDDYVPSIGAISKKTGIDSKEIQERFDKILEVWKMPNPEKFPTNNGFYSQEEATINALVNQHRLRWNPKIEDYNVTKMHWLSGEMGVGTLFTNNEAFLGEKIVRQAMDVDDYLVSYHMQGGIMPELVTMFGKAKNKRAIMTGLNRTVNGTDKNELELIIQQLNLLNTELERPSLSEKSIKNLEKYVVNTIDSMEEAAENAGFELAEQVRNLESHSELHLYWSYNDDYNQSEIEDKNIALMRKIHGRMEKALKEIPQLEEKKENLEEDYIKQEIDFQLTNKVYNYLVNKRKNLGDEEFEETGKGFKENVKEFFETKKGNRRYNLDKNLRKNLKEKAKNSLGREFETFDSIFEDAWNDFYDNYTTMKKISEHRDKINRNFDKTEKELQKTKNKLNEAKAFENSRLVELTDSPAWFTKKIAITPTEAKALETIKKDIYKGLYENYLIPSLKKHSGINDLQVYLHTDDIMSVEIPDPQFSIEGKKNDPDRPLGTIFTSLPRTNAQWSNEPLINSFVKLQGFHEGEISKAISKGKKRPEKKKEFNKRDFAHTDYYFSSWGADGYKSQRKFTIDPTTVQGEYAQDAHITGYIKIPTRHDLSELGELMVKGNKGTWAGKRLAKGETVSGSVLLVQHPDGSDEEIFFDDFYFQQIANLEIPHGGGGRTISLGKKYNELERRLSKAKTKTQIKKIEKEKEELLEIARPQIGRLFLENDTHIGSYSTPGRPSNPDIISSSQLAAIQSYGVDGFEMALMTEALHGELGFRSYDSKRESATNDDVTHLTDPVNFMKRVNLLESKMKKDGANEKQILEAVKNYTEEYQDGLPAFKPEDQLNMFDTILLPINKELMEKDVILFAGTGNHWMGKKENQSESTVIAGRFDRKYQEQQVLQMGQGTSGQSYSYDYLKFPSNDGKGIDAVFTHKMWHGSTEIDNIATQAVRSRSPAIYYVTADRHHPGAMANHGKMAVLDIGKQSTIPYAKMIGKSASVNGTMIAGYGMGGEQILSARYFINPIIDKLSGWEYKAGILKKARSLIIEAENDNSIAREFRDMNSRLGKVKKKQKDLTTRLNS